MLYFKAHKLISFVLFVTVGVMLTLSGCSDTSLQSADEGPSLDVQSSRHHMGTPPGLSNGNGPADHAKANKTIVEIASSNDQFSILVKAVKFAGLVDELNGRRQLTVFAPTNAAFEDLLSQLDLTASELFTEENKPLVKSILLYHVVPGKRFAKVVVTSEKLNTLQKEFLMVKTMNGSPIIGNDDNGYANIVATDIFASNGVVHVVDQVLLQPSF